MNIRETVHDLIANNRIEKAIQTLVDFLEDKNDDLYKIALSLSRRSSDLGTKKRRGLIEDEKANIESNAISNELYDLAEYASGNKVFQPEKTEDQTPKPSVNVENAGIVGDEVNLEGEYVAGGNITINNYYTKDEDKEEKSNNPDISEAELSGLKITEEILIEKLGDLRKAFAILSDGAKKFELKKSVEQAEAELAEIHKKMGK